MATANQPIDLTNVGSTGLSAVVGRHILPLAPGDTVDFMIQYDRIERATSAILGVAKQQNKSVKVRPWRGEGCYGVKVLKMSDTPPPKPDLIQIDLLEFGASVTFPVSPSNAHCVRTACNTRNRAERYRRYSYRVTGDGITVTCNRPDDIGANRHGVQSKYPDIDRLKIGESVSFLISPCDVGKIRGACSHRAKTFGVAYRCTANDEGITVTRIPTPADNMPMPDLPRRPSPRRASRWDLDRLATQSTLTFTNLEPGDGQRLRLACSQKAAGTGWKISCSIQRGSTTATVTRVQAPAQ